MPVAIGEPTAAIGKGVLHQLRLGRIGTIVEPASLHARTVIGVEHILVPHSVALIFA